MPSFRELLEWLLLSSRTTTSWELPQTMFESKFPNPPKFWCSRYKSNWGLVSGYNFEGTSGPFLFSSDSPWVWGSPWAFWSLNLTWNFLQDLPIWWILGPTFAPLIYESDLPKSEALDIYSSQKYPLSLKYCTHLWVWAFLQSAGLSIHHLTSPVFKYIWNTHIHKQPWKIHQ